MKNPKDSCVGLKSIAVAVENIGDRKYKYHGSGVDEPGRNYKTQVTFKF